MRWLRNSLVWEYSFPPNVLFKWAIRFPRARNDCLWFGDSLVHCPNAILSLIIFPSKTKTCPHHWKRAPSSRNWCATRKRKTFHFFPFPPPSCLNFYKRHIHSFVGLCIQLLLLLTVIFHCIAYREKREPHPKDCMVCSVQAFATNNYVE